VFGPESSGKTTLAMHAIAEVQRQGGTAALIDAEHAFDPVYSKVHAYLILCNVGSFQSRVRVLGAGIAAEYRKTHGSLGVSSPALLGCSGQNCSQAASRGSDMPNFLGSKYPTVLLSLCSARA